MACSLVAKSRHDEPKDIFYEGGFDSVTRCNSCGCVALRYDAHPLRPCKHCGGTVVDIGAGKWIEPVYKREFFRMVLVSPGYWVGVDNMRIGGPV